MFLAASDASAISVLGISIPWSLCLRNSPLRSKILSLANQPKKNRLCNVVPLPNSAEDFVPMTLAAMINQFNWSQDKPLREWIGNNRLDGFTKLTRGVAANDKEKMDILTRMRNTAPKAVSNLMKLAEQIASEA